MDTMQISLPPPSADPERGGPPPHYPLWSPKCLLWIGILTSFVFSGVMQGINYGRMGQPRRRKTWIIGSVLGFLALETLLWIVPEVYIPLLINLLINTIIAVFVGIQGLRDFRAHESAGEETRTGRTADRMRVGLLPDSRRTSRRRYAHRLRDQPIPPGKCHCRSRRGSLRISEARISALHSKISG